MRRTPAGAAVQPLGPHLPADVPNPANNTPSPYRSGDRGPSDDRDIPVTESPHPTTQQDESQVSSPLQDQEGESLPGNNSTRGELPVAAVTESCEPPRAAEDPLHPNTNHTRGSITPRKVFDYSPSAEKGAPSP